MENFTPITALIGGLLIGSSAAITLWMNGRIAGISGIVAGIIVPQGGDTIWRTLFVAGLLGGSLLAMLIFGGTIELELQASAPLTIVAGLLVGFGTRLGSGCTSGHGICGLARFSRRSFTATALFMITAIITVFVTRHVMGLSQ